MEGSSVTQLQEIHSCLSPGEKLLFVASGADLLSFVLIQHQYGRGQNLTWTKQPLNSAQNARGKELAV